jgi:hydrogenase assembly chaperone HypC/HupF
MCITAPGQIIELDARGAVVETAGARRRASTLIVPDVAVGDWVLVGAGSILRRLDATEALGLARAITDAIAMTNASSTTRLTTEPAAPDHAAPEGDPR